jgi:DNA-binding helix-turn-helix protein
LRELDTVFEKFQRSRITSIKEGTSHRHPHINRGGLLGANLAASRGKK